jgi:hypothetical protein
MSTTPEPNLELVYTIFCEDVRFEATNHLSLMGVSHQVVVPQLPVTMIKFAVVTHWRGEGQYLTEVRILTPDRMNTVAVSQPASFVVLRDGYADNVTIFVNLNFFRRAILVQTLVDSSLFAESVLTIVQPNQAHVAQTTASINRRHFRCGTGVSKSGIANTFCSSVAGRNELGTPSRRDAREGNQGGAAPGIQPRAPPRPESARPSGLTLVRSGVLPGRGLPTGDSPGLPRLPQGLPRIPRDGPGKVVSTTILRSIQAALARYLVAFDSLRLSARIPDFDYKSGSRGTIMRSISGR